MTDTYTKSAGVEISKKLVLINSASSLVALALNITVLIWLQQFLLKRISTEEYSLLLNSCERRVEVKRKVRRLED